MITKDKEIEQLSYDEKILREKLSECIARLKGPPPKYDQYLTRPIVTPRSEPSESGWPYSEPPRAISMPVPACRDDIDRPLPLTINGQLIKREERPAFIVMPEPEDSVMPEQKRSRWWLSG